MRILISIFLFFILGLWTSKYKIKIQQFSKLKNSKQLISDVNVGIYWFGLIKIAGFCLRNDGIHFLLWKMPYPKGKNHVQKLKPYFRLHVIKDLDMKLEKFHAAFEIGLENSMATIFLVSLMATAFSILPAQGKMHINPENYHYQILPNYNNNLFYFKISAQISGSVYRLFKTIRKMQQMPQKQKIRFQEDLENFFTS